MSDHLTPAVARKILKAHNAVVAADPDCALTGTENQTLRVLLETAYGLNPSQLDLFYGAPAQIASSFPALQDVMELEVEAEDSDDNDPSGDGGRADDDPTDKAPEENDSNESETQVVAGPVPVQEPDPEQELDPVVEDEPVTDEDSEVASEDQESDEGQEGDDPAADGDDSYSY